MPLTQLVSLRTLALTLIIAAGSAVAIVACQPRKPQPTPPGGTPTPVDPQADLRRFPLGIESAEVVELVGVGGDKNARLEVSFEKDDRLRASGVSIFPQEKEVRLRDDGREGDAKANDGIFSATIAFNFEELDAQAKILGVQRDRKQIRPVFSGRQIIGTESTADLDARLERIRPLLDRAELNRSPRRFNLFDLRSSVDPASIDPNRSLMIIHPSVVSDPTRTIDPCSGSGNPNGVWTFKHLVTEMVAPTGVDPADFVENWLKLWLSNQPVSSGFIGSPRAAMLPKVLNAWPRTSAGKLDLDRSPFRLSAIVNRIDLAENLVYGGGSAGEGRFIFGVWDRSQSGCVFMPFSVIFEYGVEKRGCRDLRKWAQDWTALSSLALGTPAYNTALEALTTTFTKANTAPAKPNGSALNQLRTNENALNFLWELREFRIDAASHQLVQVTTKQTPDETLNGGAKLASYINTNAAQIVLERHVVPDRFPTATDPFMAATSQASAGQLGTHFNAAGISNPRARFHFSLNTCTACHIAETGTNVIGPGNNAFLHVDPKTMPATLSRFLTGSTPTTADSPDPFNVTDPADAVTIRAFNDLERRRQKLADLAGSSCLRAFLVPPRRLLEPILRDPIAGERRLDPRLGSAFGDPVRMVH